MYRLYHMPLSPFSRKVRLVLAEKDVEFELIEERPWERRLDFLWMNPAGKVPVLKGEGLVISESRAICEYLDEKYPKPPLMPATPEERAEVRRLVGWFDDKFHNEVTANLLYERVNKKLAKSGHPESAKVKAGRKNIRFHIDYMGWLLDKRKWLASDTITLADFAAAAHISCLDYMGDIDWKMNEDVYHWYSKIKSRKAFREVLADRIPGFVPPEHYSDLDFE